MSLEWGDLRIVDLSVTSGGAGDQVITIRPTLESELWRIIYLVSWHEAAADRSCVWMLASTSMGTFFATPAAMWSSFVPQPFPQRVTGNLLPVHLPKIHRHVYLSWRFTAAGAGEIGRVRGLVEVFYNLDLVREGIAA